MNPRIEHEVKPEPPADEREAIEAALAAAAASTEPPPYRSAWRRALEIDDA